MKSALVWSGSLLILAGFLLFASAFSHFPSKYWGQEGFEVRWYEIAGLQWNDEDGKTEFELSLVQPEKGEPTSEELRQLAIARDPSFFAERPLNERIYLINVRGGDEFRAYLYGQGYEDLGVALAAFEVIPIRPGNGLVIAVASVVLVLGLISITLGRRKTVVVHDTSEL